MFDYLEMYETEEKQSVEISHPLQKGFYVLVSSNLQTVVFTASYIYTSPTHPFNPHFSHISPMLIFQYLYLAIIQSYIPINLS